MSEPNTGSRRELPRPELAFALLAIIAPAIVLSLAGGASFWHDDCDFLHLRSFSDAASLFLPHNDHAVVIPAVLFRLVVEIAGTDSYLPFLALVQVAHVVTAIGLFVVLRPRSRWLAIGAGTLFLFFGSGSDNFFWAFQITFVGSTAFGVWTVWAADRRKWPLAAALGTGSVFCSLVGVPFLVAAAAIGLVRRERGALWLGLPGAMLSAWWLTFGLGWERPPDWAVAIYGNPLDLESWLLVPGFVVRAIVITVGSISGLAYVGGVVGVVAITAIGVTAWRKGWRPSPVQVAAVIGLAVFLVMTGVVRAPSSPGLAGRHMYVSALLVLMALPLVHGRRSVALASAFGIAAIVINVAYLPLFADHWAVLMAGPLACVP